VGQVNPGESSLEYGGQKKRSIVLKHFIQLKLLQCYVDLQVDAFLLLLNRDGYLYCCLADAQIVS